VLLLLKRKRKRKRKRISFIVIDITVVAFYYSGGAFILLACLLACVSSRLFLLPFTLFFLSFCSFAFVFLFSFSFSFFSLFSTLILLIDVHLTNFFKQKLQKTVLFKKIILDVMI